MAGKIKALVEEEAKDAVINNHIKKFSASGGVRTNGCRTAPIKQ